MPTISVRLRTGRSDQQKTEFARAVTEAAVRILRADQHAIRIEYVEVAPTSADDTEPGGEATSVTARNR